MAVALNSQEDSWYLFVSGSVNTSAIVRLKNSIASSGIEPTTFRLVYFFLNQQRYRVPITTLRAVVIYFINDGIFSHNIYI
jgi:hypothetical protein